MVAVHSLSKRSNLAGLRAGFYAGDADLVRYLSEVRKHVGMLVPGPVQAAAVVALADDTHVDEQRERYRERLEFFRTIVDAPMPAGGFYLWAPVPGGDAWAFTEDLAARGGALCLPGDLYGAAGAGYVRVALVQPMDRLELVAERLGVGSMSEDWPRPVVHWEIEARDPEVMKAFYAALFNWDIGDGYIMDIPAGIGGPEPGPAGHIRASDRSRVTLFIQVRDLRDSLDRAATLGGAIVAEPFDVEGGPTFAGITDPEGNPVMLVQQ